MKKGLRFDGNKDINSRYFSWIIFVIIYSERFKRKGRNDMKKPFYQITATFLVLMMLTGEGCITKGLKVEDYPDYQDLIYGENGNGANSNIPGEGNMYNIELLNPAYKDDVPEEVQNLAIDMIKAVSEGKESVEVKITDAKPTHANLAFSLAYYSNPVMELVEMNYDSDRKVCDFTYVVDNPAEKCKKFEQNVNNLFANCINLSDNDEKKAKALYGYLINELEYDHEYETAWRDGTINSYSNDAYLLTIDCLENKTAHFDNVLFLYTFCLNQLEIKSLIIGGSGKLTYTKSAELTDLVQNSNIWMIITIGDNSYHCDTFFEAAVLYEDRKKDPDAQCKYLFFGMSDKTRDDSFDTYYTGVGFILDPALGKDIPKCDKEYK